LPLRLPKTHFRHNRHYCHVYHSCTDESVLPTDTNDTVLRGSTANWRNCRNWNRRFRFACKALKHRVLSAKCRIHRDLQIMAVIESLPLRQHFNFRLLNIAFHQLWLRPHEILLDAIRAPRVRLASASLALE